MAPRDDLRTPSAWLRALGLGPDSIQLRVVWRIIGGAMLMVVALTVRHDVVSAIGPRYPLEFHAMAASALALVVFGPRLVVLLCASAAWLVLFNTVNTGSHPALPFVADEFVLFLAVPVLAALSTIVCVFEHDPALDPPLPRVVARAHLWMLRLCGLVALGFAALHKLNSDFFAPRLSCVAVVGRKLGALWSVQVPLPSPTQLFVLEALTPLLLLLYPRLGVALALVLATGLGHAGPYPFNTLLLGLALAFLPAEHAERWSSRRRLLLVIYAPLALVVAAVSASLWRASGGWAPFLAFDLVLALVLALLLVGLRREPLRPRLARPTLPGRYLHRSLCVYAASILIINGLSPYLGLKFRHSFAMLSNLRADDSRWNSLVFPRAMRLRDDPLVHVLAVEDPGGAPLHLPRTRARIVRPGVYSPQEFAARLAESQRRQTRATLRLRHRGVEHVFREFTRSSELQRFTAALPVQRLFQDELALTGRQQCVH